MAAETDAGGNSGIDTLMRTLSEKRFIDDRASTLDGPWMQRITEARSANGEYFCSTITPSSDSCGVHRVHGNLTSSAVLRFGPAEMAPRYDRKVYLADFYLGFEDLASVLARPSAALERIRRKVTQADLYRTWKINWAGSSDEDVNAVGRWDKRRLWEYLVEYELLRVILFVAGEGPRASGMRQVGFPVSAEAAALGNICILATDGRVVYGHPGASISQMVPEALEDGGLAAVRAGDWVWLSLRQSELHLVTPSKNAAGYRVLREREVSRRPEVARRVHELGRRRNLLLPSMRSLFDGVSSAVEGVSPAQV
jgi:dihydroxyacid dehydratase/phosphogluconate dehydratase